MVRKKTIITVIIMKETLKETNRLKSKCSINSSIYALLKGYGLLLLIRKRYMTITPNLCTKQHRNNTETRYANMRYAKSLTPSPTVAMSSSTATIFAGTADVASDMGTGAKFHSAEDFKSFIFSKCVDG